MTFDIKATDPYGTHIPSPIPNPTGPGDEPIPLPSLQDRYPDMTPVQIGSRKIQHVMRRHLNGVEPRVRRWLYATWNASRQAIKYQELRDAVTTGQMPVSWIIQWQKNYVDLVNEQLIPQWRKTAEHAVKDLERVAAEEGFEFVGKLTLERLSDWIAFRGGDLIVALSDAQHRAIRGVLHRFTLGPDAVGSRELGRILRPMIGLTPAQARAVANLRSSLAEQVRAGELTRRQMDHFTGNYAGRLHRIRAERIARTETSFAYNMGMLQRMREETNSGNVRGVVVKEFLTADDEKVCPHCGPLDGETIELEQTFPGATRKLPNLLTPPLHPGCRCAIVYQILRPDDA